MPSFRLGHRGVLCAYCAEGWVKAKGLCMPCQSFDTGKLLQMVAVYGGLCVFFWRKVRKTPSWPRSWANFSLF
jgi:hypothetical protein